MTVRDLIEKLKQYDPDDQVVVLDVDGDDYEIINTELAGFGGRVVDLVIYKI